jgi:hypothetical protein
MGKTINDIAEQQKYKKSHDDHREKFHCQYIAEVLHALKIKQNPVKNNESARPKNNAGRTEHKNTHPVVSFIIGAQVIDCGKYSRF